MGTLTKRAFSSPGGFKDDKGVPLTGDKRALVGSMFNDAFFGKRENGEIVISDETKALSKKVSGSETKTPVTNADNASARKVRRTGMLGGGRARLTGKDGSLLISSDNLKRKTLLGQ